MKIKVNDQVKILTGKDRGKTAKVLQVFPRLNKVVVEGVHMIKRHLRPAKSGEKGRIVELAGPIAASTAAVVCPKCQKATRIGYTIEGDKKKRVCRKCKEAIE